MIRNKIYKNGKLTNMEYVNSDLILKVEVLSFFAVKKLNKDDSNAGKIIENYREKEKNNKVEAEEYYDSKLLVLNKFIESVSDQPKTYEYVQVMLPRDQRRRRFIESFSRKIYDGSNDFSTHIAKTVDKSIAKEDCKEVKKIFCYKNPEKLNSVRTLHFIDDTIDSGCTLKIFLDSLVNEKIINSNTSVTASIVYNYFSNNDKRMSKAQLDDLLNS